MGDLPFSPLRPLDDGNPVTPQIFVQAQRGDLGLTESVQVDMVKRRVCLILNDYAETGARYITFADAKRRGDTFNHCRLARAEFTVQTNDITPLEPFAKPETYLSCLFLIPAGEFHRSLNRQHRPFPQYRQ